MAPTEQNIEDTGAAHSQLKNRLSNGYYKSENSVPCFENNNTVLQNSVRENDNEVFDITKYEAMEFKAKIRWPDLTVQILLHLVSIYAVYLILSLQVKILTILFALLTIYTSGFGITAGVHRLWSHRAYKAKLPMRVLLAVLFTITGQPHPIFEAKSSVCNVTPLICLVMGCIATIVSRYFLERDIYTWALDHRVHHKYTETVADPHDIRRGFWFAHVGWLVLTPHPAVEDRRAALRKTSLDLMADPVVRIQKIIFIPMFAILNIALPVWIPWHFWGETLINAFAVSFVLRFTFTLNIAFCVNSFAHLWGNKPYDKFIQSVENSMVSLAALGEGWHNYHHVFPWDYRTSELGRLNISTTFIDLCAKIGWAYDLKAVPSSMIVERAKRSGDGTLGHEEEPPPSINE